MNLEQCQEKILDLLAKLAESKAENQGFRDRNAALRKEAQPNLKLLKELELAKARVRELETSGGEFEQAKIRIRELEATKPELELAKARIQELESSESELELAKARIQELETEKSNLKAKNTSIRLDWAWTLLIFQYVDTGKWNLPLLEVHDRIRRRHNERTVKAPTSSSELPTHNTVVVDGVPVALPRPPLPARSSRWGRILQRALEAKDSQDTLSARAGSYVVPQRRER
ncbi:MAG: hypothetical protein Q9170_003541 [Blastenia crenularia]